MNPTDEQAALRAIESACTALERLIANREHQPYLMARIVGTLQGMLDTLSTCFEGEMQAALARLIHLLEQL